MKIIIGLGNPGTQYENTRHNAGFKVLDELAGRHGANFSTESKFKSQVTKTIIGGESVLLVKPQTFMNLSGDAVALILGYYKATAEDLLIIFDDLSASSIISLKIKSTSCNNLFSLSFIDFLISLNIF